MTVHVEACPRSASHIAGIKALGCGAGVALNPHTPASVLSEVIHMLDVIIVMSVNPGFGDKPFLPEVLSKTRQHRQND
jgi:ribulose-phosphate 3-epimerase